MQRPDPDPDRDPDPPAVPPRARSCIGPHSDVAAFAMPTSTAAVCLDFYHHLQLKALTGNSWNGNLRLELWLDFFIGLLTLPALPFLVRPPTRHAAPHVRSVRLPAQHDGGLLSGALRCGVRAAVGDVHSYSRV